MFNFSDDDAVPDYPAMQYIRCNSSRFPPSGRAPPFDVITCSSTIVLLEDLSVWTSFYDVQLWLGGVAAFQAVIRRDGGCSEVFVEVLRPREVVALFRDRRPIRGRTPRMSIASFPHY